MHQRLGNALQRVLTDRYFIECLYLTQILWKFLEEIIVEVYFFQPGEVFEAGEVSDLIFGQF